MDKLQEVFDLFQVWCEATRKRATNGSRVSWDLWDPVRRRAHEALVGCLGSYNMRSAMFLLHAQVPHDETIHCSYAACPRRKNNKTGNHVHLHSQD